MAIYFANSASLQQVGGLIHTPGRIVQTVTTLNSTALQTTAATPVDYFTSTAITMTKSTNKLVIEWHVDARTNDWGDGLWNLYYMDLIHVQSGAQLAYTGFEGEYTYNIKHTHRSAYHAPGTVGPHSYKLRGWSYTAGKNVSFNGTGGWVSNDNQSWIRITEIAA